MFHVLLVFLSISGVFVSNEAASSDNFKSAFTSSSFTHNNDSYMIYHLKNTTVDTALWVDDPSLVSNCRAAVNTMRNVEKVLHVEITFSYKEGSIIYCGVSYDFYKASDCSLGYDKFGVNIDAFKQFNIDYDGDAEWLPMVTTSAQDTCIKKRFEVYNKTDYNCDGPPSFIHCNCYINYAVV